MKQLPSSAEIAQLAQALMLGTRRRPIALPPGAAALAPSPGGIAPALLALVLAGQRARFDRPASVPLEPPSESERALHAGPDPMLPRRSRRLMRQLFAMVKRSDPGLVCKAAIERVFAKGMRLHPFDLPELATHVRTTGDRPFRAPESGLAALDPESWQALPYDQQLEALRRLRLASPEAGRALLEAVYSAQNETHRAILLPILRARLSADDQPFLEKAARDRGHQAKQAALHLIGSIPGTPAYDARLERASRLFAVSGPKGKPEKLSLSYAKMKAAGVQVTADIFQSFDGLRLADLAERLGLEPDAYIEALPSDNDPLRAAISTAAAENDAALCTRLIGKLTLSDLSWLFKPGGFMAGEPCHSAMTEAFIALLTRGDYPGASVLHSLYQHQGGPLPEALAAHLLAGDGWLRHLIALRVDDDKKKDETLTATALLVPDSMLDAFAAQLEGLPAHLTLHARMFIEFCKSLGETTPVPSLTQSPE